MGLQFKSIVIIMCLFVFSSCGNGPDAKFEYQGELIVNTSKQLPLNEDAKINELTSENINWNGIELQFKKMYYDGRNDDQKKLVFENDKGDSIVVHIPLKIYPTETGILYNSYLKISANIFGTPKISSFQPIKLLIKSGKDSKKDYIFSFSEPVLAVYKLNGVTVNSKYNLSFKFSFTQD